MGRQITKFELMQALFTRESGVKVITPQGEAVIGILQSVTREDGSGDNFILTMIVNKQVRQIFAKIER